MREGLGNKARVQHILEAVSEILSFNKDLDFESFSKDSKTVHATVRLFEIIGEASNKISKDLKSEHPEIPWTRMVGMRNFLIHEYYEVNREIVWGAINDDLPKLKAQLQEILPQL